MLTVFEGRRRVYGDRHLETRRALFDLACLDARRGNRAEALAWLEQSIDVGFAEPEALAEEPALDSLRDDPAFAALVDRARRNATDPRSP